MSFKPQLCLLNCGHGNDTDHLSDENWFFNEVTNGIADRTCLKENHIQTLTSILNIPFKNVRIFPERRRKLLLLGLKQVRVVLSHEQHRSKTYWGVAVTHGNRNRERGKILMQKQFQQEMHHVCAQQLRAG